MAHGDLNGDGIVDIVVGAAMDRLSVLIGNGNGTFSAASQIVTGAGQATSVAIGDFDGDGYQDIATLGTALTLLRGMGTGTFFPSGLVNWATNAAALRATDLDGNGRLDLVFVDDGNVELEFNTGSGFNRVELTIAGGASTLELADFNGDGKADLAVPNEKQAGAVTVLLGDGLGGFTPKVTLATAVYPRIAAISDVNGDGKPDIVVGHSYVGTIEVYLGIGDGTFSIGTPASVPNEAFDLHLADFDVDGTVDVIAIDRNGARATLLPGNGDGTFKAGRSFLTPDRPVALDVVDVDGDSFPDVAVVSNTRSAIGLLTSRGQKLPFETAVAFSPTQALRSVTAVDVDGDGLMDVVSEEGLRFGKGDGTFAATLDLGLPNGLTAKKVLVGRIDGDMAADWIGLTSSNTIALVLGDGKGSYKSTTPITDLWFSPETAVIADVTGDGFSDVVVGYGASAQLLVGNGKGALAASNPTQMGGAILAAGDIDGDGKAEVLGASGANLVDVFGFDGNNLARRLQLSGTGSYVNAILLADVDADGILDVVLAGGPNKAAIYRGKGNGTFFPLQSLTLRAEPRSLGVGDLDGDGVADLIMGFADGAVGVMRGLGKGQFEPEKRFVTAGQFLSPLALADFDGNGRIDVVAGATLLLNRASVICGLPK